MSRIPGESINTSYPRRAAWTLRATQAVMRRFDDVRISGERAEINRLQDMIEWLDRRDKRIMTECLANEQAVEVRLRLAIDTAPLAERIQSAIDALPAAGSRDDDHDYRADSIRDDGPWMPREDS
jgi:hypothetical protein